MPTSEAYLMQHAVAFLQFIKALLRGARLPYYALALPAALLFTYALRGANAETTTGRILLSMPWSYSHQSATQNIGRDLTARGWRVKVIISGRQVVVEGCSTARQASA